MKREERNKKMEENKQMIAYEPVNIFDLQDEDHLLLQNLELQKYGLCYIWHNI